MADVLKQLSFIVVVFVVVLGKSNCHVVEIDERFNDARSEGNWFVKFYAPWCGHCRKLEPVWNEVAQELQSSSVRVGRVDCTKHSGISQEFSIKGFPTILFIKGEHVFRYNGDRSKEDLLDFARKAEGPALKALSSSGQLRDVQNTKDVFFLLVTEDSTQTSLKDEFTKVAEKKQTKASFYTIEKKSLLKDVPVSETPSLLVVKSKTYNPYLGDVSYENISSWVNRERFPIFGVANRASFYELGQTEKPVVFAVFAEDKSKKVQNRKVGEITKAVAEKSETHRSLFQFSSLMGDEIVTAVMMSYVELPIVFVYNHQTMVYHYLESTNIDDNFSEEKLKSFLDDITEEKILGHGGDSYFQRVKRIVYQIWETVHEVWSTHPLLAIVMFGLPTLLFSFLFYTICCAEHSDDDEEYDGEFEDDFGDETVDKDEQESSDLPPPYEPESSITQPDKSKID